MTRKAYEAPVSLIEDENGLWTKALPQPRPVQVAQEYNVPIVKFFAKERVCPIHGQTKVLDRNVIPDDMNCTEGLARGCILLITRVVQGLKPLRSGGYPAHTQQVLRNPKNWLFRNWRLTFKTPVLAPASLIRDLRAAAQS